MDISNTYLFNVKRTFFNKMQQQQQQKQQQQQRQQQQQKHTNTHTHVKKQKILYNFDRTPEENLKVRVQNYLECRGYLRKAKSL